MGLVSMFVKGMICRMQCGAPFVPFGSSVLGSHDVDC